MLIELPILLAVALIAGLVILTFEVIFLFRNRKIIPQISSSTHAWILLIGFILAKIWYEIHFYINTPFIPVIDLSIVSNVIICLVFALAPYCWIFFVVSRKMVLTPLKEHTKYALKLILIYLCILISTYLTMPSLVICLYNRNYLLSDYIHVGGLLLVGSSIVSIVISIIGIRISNTAAKLELGSSVKHSSLLCLVNKIILVITPVFGFIACMVGHF